MTDPTCPVCDGPLPPYRHGRPWVYCSVDCRRRMASWRRDLEDERHHVEAKEASAQTAVNKEQRAYYAKYAQKDRDRLTDVEARIARADELVRGASA